MELPNCFYRVSVKALVLNETKDKFLVCQKSSGVWELPGGGLEWGECPKEELKREIMEEMGIQTHYIADQPKYLFTGKTLHRGIWVVNAVYETQLEHFNFLPSDECVHIQFVDKEDVKGMKVFPTIMQLVDVFDQK